MEHTAELNDLLTRSGFQRFELNRTPVGHWRLKAILADRELDVLLDTGAASTVVDLAFCRQHGLAVRETSELGGGAGGVHLTIYVVDDVQFCMGDIALRSDGIYALDLSHVNQGLTMRGAEPTHAVLGADILTHHQAVIDYASGSLYMKPVG